MECGQLSEAKKGQSRPGPEGGAEVESAGVGPSLACSSTDDSSNWAIAVFFGRPGRIPPRPSLYCRAVLAGKEGGGHQLTD
jgi:hypothetical protein